MLELTFFHYRQKHRRKSELFSQKVKKTKPFPSFNVHATSLNVAEEDSQQINDDELEMKTFGKCDVEYQGITNFFAANILKL